MPKPMYVWTGTAWVSVASEVESLATYATQSYADNLPGTKLIIPSSISLGSGSGSVGTQGTVTFSSASSVSLNGVFSSTYRNYLIIANYKTGVADATVSLRLRSGTTDNSSSNYSYGLYYVGAEASVAAGSTNNNTTTSFPFATNNTTMAGSFINIYAPQISEITSITSHSSGRRLEILSGSMTVTTAYDGFTISGNSMTGTINVYGYKAG